MGKKDLVHIGKRRFWSEKVDTLCGLTFGPDNNKEEGGWFVSVTCPDCKRIERGGK